MAMLSNQDLIRRVPLFANLTLEQVEDLAGNVTKRKIKKGEDVVQQGEISNALYLILSGRAHVVKTDSKGKEVILATLKAGDYIGEMSLIDNEAHSATVQADTQMDVLVLGREDFTRCSQCQHHHHGGCYAGAWSSACAPPIKKLFHWP